MRHPCRSLLAGLALVFLAAPAVPAQSPSSATMEDQARALARLRPRDQVRVFARGDRLIGRLAGTTAGDLWLTEDSAEQTVPLAAIDSVLVGRSAAGRGALIGAISGLVLGGLAGFVALQNQPLEDTPEWVVPAFGAGSGMVLGALVGLLIGAGSRRWVRAYPAPDRPAGP